MRRLRFTLILCVLVQCFTPAPAHAWFWEYLEELSGPGPFRGPAFEWRLVCFSEPDPSRANVEETTDENRLAAARVVQFFGPGCFFKQVPLQNQRRASINLKFGMLSAKENHLEYTGTPDRDVKLTTLLPNFAWRPTRFFETSMGVGVYWFSGPSFQSFHRLVIQPIQADLKPLAAINSARGAEAVWWDELISLRAGVIIVPQGFDAADFGAIPGTFRTSRESLKNAAVFLDLDSLVRKMRTADRPNPARPPAGRR
jgi:hypothetical protein